MCHSVYTSSVVTSTDMIPCRIVSLCSGVLLLSKQHCLFSFVICILYSSVYAGFIGGGVSVGIVLAVGGVIAVIIFIRCKRRTI